MKVSSSSSILSLVLALNGVIASPIRARDYDVVTVYQYETEVVHVTLTTWVDPEQYAPTPVPTTTIDPNEKKKNDVATDTPSVSISETLASPTVSSSISELSVVPSSTLAYSSVETTQQTTSSIPSTPVPSTTTTTPVPSTSTPTTTPPTTTSLPTTTSEPPTSTPSSYPTSISVPTSTQAPPTTLEKSTSSAPTTSVSTPPVVKPEPSTVAPAPSPSSPAKAPSAGNGGSTTYTGDATFYSTGMGSCGITSQDTDCIVAMPASVMNALSTGNPNKNPLCGKTILVSYNGGPEIVVTIVDTCPECKPNDLDLSPAAFKKMGASQDAGRVTVTWRYA